MAFRAATEVRRLVGAASGCAVRQTDSNKADEARPKMIVRTDMPANVRSPWQILASHIP